LEFTLDASGLKPSLGRPAGGVRTLLTTAGVGCVVLVGAYAGYLLCIADRWSGGGSWKVGRLEAADLRAVKLCAVSIMEDDCEVHGDDF
jgi:hypothetical protein